MKSCKVFKDFYGFLVGWLNVLIMVFYSATRKSVGFLWGQCYFEKIRGAAVSCNFVCSLMNVHAQFRIYDGLYFKI